MKEMVYTDHPDRIVLDSGTKDGYEWVILSLGFHPCAYVKIPKGYPRYKFRCDDYARFSDIVCHGGITYVDHSLDTGDGETNHGHWIGWDYQHARDFSGRKDYDELNKICNAKKWRTSEIRREVFNVINQLKKMEVLS